MNTDEDDLTKLRYEDISLLCRICLKKRKDLTNIFQATFENVKVTDILNSLFDEKPEENDGKPDKICFQCVLRTIQVNEFVNLYYKSKDTFEKLWKWEYPNTENITEVIDVEEQENVDSAIVDNTESSEIVLETLEPEELCNFCKFDFRRDPCTKYKRKPKPTLNQHILEEHLIELNAENDSCKCLKCKVDFQSLIEAEQHFYSDWHQDKKCSDCNCVFPTIKEHFGHRKRCSKPKEWQQRWNNEDYKCLHCNLKIHGFENVLEHFKSNHETDLVCMICQKFVKKHMELHVHKHRPQRMKYICLRCLCCFETQALLKDHRKNVDHSTKQCEICEMVVPSRAYRKHQLGHKDIFHMCELCGKRFRERGNLMRHRNLHHFGRRFYCDQCPQSFSTNAIFMRHMMRVHPEIKLNWKPGKSHTNRFSPSWINKTIKANYGQYVNCKFCYKRMNCSNRRMIKIHEMNHRFGHTVMCVAPGCEMTFADSGQRYEHMASSHQRLTCDHCQKIFFNTDNFQVHCLLHVWKNSDFKYKENCSVCRICDLDCPDMNSLIQHVSREHKLYLCSKNCGKIFANKISAQKHFEKMHENATGEFQCTICSEKFSTEVAFLDHEKRHSKSRKYKCDLCTFTFSTVGQLTIHIRTHTGEKPYSCKFCSMTFSTTYNRNLHERLHTGEKPHYCRYCGKSFSDPSYFRKHCRRHEIQDKKTEME